MMKKYMKRENELRVGQAQHTIVYSWSCGNRDRTSNDQNQIDRVAELITKVHLATDKDGRDGTGGER